MRSTQYVALFVALTSCGTLPPEEDTMKNLTPSASYATVSVPEDGVDQRTAASLEPAFQALADRDAEILRRYRNVADLTALGALTGNAAGDVAIVDAMGVYTYTTSTITDDGLGNIAASGGGTWVASNTGPVMVAWGEVQWSTTNPTAVRGSGMGGARGLSWTLESGYPGGGFEVSISGLTLNTAKTYAVVAEEIQISNGRLFQYRWGISSGKLRVTPYKIFDISSWSSPPTTTEIGNAYSSMGAVYAYPIGTALTTKWAVFQ